MGDDHVAEGAGFLVEVASHLDRERLRHVDLHVVDMVRFQTGSNMPLAKRTRQQVLHRLPAEVVIDAEDLLLGEDRVDERVERPRRGEVTAERLLHDHPRPLAQSQPPKPLDHAGIGDRRQREVVEELGIVGELLPGPGDSAPQALEPIAKRSETQALDKAIQGLARVRPAPGATDGVPDQLDELPFAEGAARRPDNREPLRHQPGLEKVEDPRQQLPLRQVPSRPKQHDDLTGRPGDAPRPTWRLCDLDGHDAQPCRTGAWPRGRGFSKCRRKRHSTSDAFVLRGCGKPATAELRQTPACSGGGPRPKRRG